MPRIYLLRVAAMMWLAVLLAPALISGAAAQASSPFVVITEVDSQTFPQVMAYIAVSGPDGSPLANPTEAKFLVFEDKIPVPTPSITLEKQVFKDLRLVLALDTSVPVEALTKMKAAAKAMLEMMEPSDRVALLTFGDKARVVHDFTNNKTELEATVETLTVQGDKTALNQAATEAVDLITKLSTGRKAVIILTDSKDNTGAAAAAEFIGSAQAGQIPLYLVGFGSKVQPDALKEMAGRTGGQAFILSSSDQVQATLLKITDMLRQGYRLTFESGLKADNAEHDLSISVTSQGGQGQAEARFIAKPGTITVTLPNLADGQNVAGVVNLTAQATAPAPIASIEYLLDDQSLAKLAASPYRFDWNSAAVPAGLHTLTVIAIDSAGNKGQAALSLNVVTPLMVTVSTAQKQVNLGDQLPITTKIEAATEITKVEFWLDSTLLGSHSAPPYSFSLDSSKYVAGKHTLMVRVEDSLGRKAEDSVTVEFLAPPPRQPNRSNGLLRGTLMAMVILMAIAAIILLLLLFRFIVGWQRGRRRGKYQLAIANLGNIPSQYELWAADLVGALKFQFRLNGALLPQYSVAEPGEGAEPAEYRQVIPVTTVPATPPAGPAAKAGPSASASLASARQTAEGVMNTGSIIADLLTTVAYLLPGSLGRPFRNMADQLLQRQGQISQATRTPSMMVRRAKQLPGQAGQVLPSRPTASAGASAAQTVTPPLQTARSSSQIRAPSPPSNKTRRQAAMATPETGQTRVQTPLVEPDQTLMIELLITSLKPYQSQDYTFRVSSRSVEPVEAPPATEQGNIYIKGISWFSRLILVVLTGTAIVGVLVMVTYAMQWLVEANVAAWPLLGRLAG